MVRPPIKHKNRLLRRLDDIAAALARTGRAQALLALGSVGLDTSRIDEFSDLDFFAIVDPGCKATFLDDLSWLTDIAPAAYVYRNTVDGFKLLYDDGILCEFAVFEAGELARIPFSPGRLVWKRDDVDEAMAIPTVPVPSARSDVDWLAGEILTNLYVGLLRDRRGERMSAFRLIQVEAVERLAELIAAMAGSGQGDADPFVPARRFETRFPAMAKQLAAFMPGYDDNRGAARNILASLESNRPVPAAMKRHLLQLIDAD